MKRKKITIILLIPIIILVLGYIILKPFSNIKSNYDILCIGDSITTSSYGDYTKHLADFINTKNIKLKVCSGARPGNTTGEYLKYLKRSNLLKKTTPNYVIVMLGTNDVRIDGDNTPANQFYNNMKTIIKIIKNHKNPDGSKIIIFIATIPPIFNIDLNPFNKTSKTRIDKEIVPLIKKIAKEEKINLIDIYTYFKNKPELLPGIHPNKDGYLSIAKFMFKNILPYIKGLELLHRNKEKLPSRFKGKIVFQSNRAGNEDIFIIDKNGVKQITYSQANDGYPSFSPDGENIVFQSDRSGKLEIHVTDINKNIKRLFESPTEDKAPFWTYDGKYIFFCRIVKGKEQVFKYSLSTKKIEQITNYKGRNALPAVSPSGRYMLITSHRFIGWNIYKVDLKTGEHDKFATGYGACRAKYSHSGKSVVLVSHEFDKKGDLFLTSPDKFSPIRLTIDSENADYFPAFSTDDRYIVYSSAPKTKSKHYNIKIIEISTRKIWEITSSQANDRFPYWGKDWKKH